MWGLLEGGVGAGYAAVANGQFNNILQHQFGVPLFIQNVGCIDGGGEVLSGICMHRPAPFVGVVVRDAVALATHCAAAHGLLPVGVYQLVG